VAPTTVTVATDVVQPDNTRQLTGLSKEIGSILHARKWTWAVSLGLFMVGDVILGFGLGFFNAVWLVGLLIGDILRLHPSFSVPDVTTWKMKQEQIAMLIQQTHGDGKNEGKNYLNSRKSTKYIDGGYKLGALLVMVRATVLSIE
jgi:hypothetical protein